MCVLVIAERKSSTVVLQNTSGEKVEVTPLGVDPSGNWVLIPPVSGPIVLTLAQNEQWRFGYNFEEVNFVSVRRIAWLTRGEAGATLAPDAKRPHQG
jgi:hypothetical protein